MHDDARQRIGRWRARKAVDLHVAEAVEGEVRLVRFVATTLECVRLHLPRRAQVLRVEVPLLVEHFGVLQPHRRAGGPAHAQTHPAHHVLPHVEDRLSGGRVQDLQRLDLFDAADRRARRRDEHVLRVIGDSNTFPRFVIEAGLAPARLLEPRIVRLAVVDVGVHDRPGGRLPSVGPY